MIANQMSRLLVLVTAGLLATALTSGGAGVPPSAQKVSPARTADLQLVVEVGSQRYRIGESPSFKISFRNSGQNNLLLNGGELLGNGAEIWSHITCGFQAAGGRRLPLVLTWGVPGVAGRLYFLGVPLRPGSSHTISVTPKDYYVGKGERLTAGTYELACTYTGVQSSIRDATQLPRCWEGVITSNAARVEVMAATR